MDLQGFQKEEILTEKVLGENDEKELEKTAGGSTSMQHRPERYSGQLAQYAPFLSVCFFSGVTIRRKLAFIFWK